MANPKESPSVYSGILQQNQIFRLKETIDLNMKKIHHPVLPIVYAKMKFMEKK